MKITQPKQAATLALNAAASGVTVVDSGGYYGGGPISLEDVLALIGAGTSPGAFLTKIGGGVGYVQALGNLGATETIDLANANYFWGTLDAACAVSFTGWTSGKDCQITVELLEDGTGGWTPTFSGVTWIGGTPSQDTTAGTVSHYVFLSRDGGTTIYGALLGSGGGSDHALVTVASSGAAETIDVAVARTYDITLDAACTVTMAGGVTGQVWIATVILRQGGTGSYTVTWDPLIDWVDPATGLGGGSAPFLHTAVGAQNVVELVTLDGGASWGGASLDAGSSDGMVPYQIDAGETFTVPIKKQALFNATIANAGTLVVDGFLILVP